MNSWCKFNKDIYISPICVNHARAMEGSGFNGPPGQAGPILWSVDPWKGWYCSCRAEEEYDGNKTTVRNMTESEVLANITVHK